MSCFSEKNEQYLLTVWSSHFLDPDLDFVKEIPLQREKWEESDARHPNLFATAELSLRRPEEDPQNSSLPHLRATVGSQATSWLRIVNLETRSKIGNSEFPDSPFIDFFFFLPLENLWRVQRASPSHILVTHTCHAQAFVVSMGGTWPSQLCGWHQWTLIAAAVQ